MYQSLANTGVLTALVTVKTSLTPLEFDVSFERHRQSAEAASNFCATVERFSTSETPSSNDRFSSKINTGRPLRAFPLIQALNEISNNLLQFDVLYKLCKSMWIGILGTQSCRESVLDRIVIKPTQILCQLTLLPPAAHFQVRSHNLIAGNVL